MRILLTGARAPVTLEMARRLHAQGHQVYMSDNLRFACAKLSKTVTANRWTPQPNVSPASYIAALNEIIRQEEIEWLLPTCEEIFFVAAARQQLECRVFADKIETLSKIHNKWTFSQIASNDAGEVPETFLIESVPQLDDYRTRTKQFVFKPVYSRFASETLVKPSAEKLNRIDIHADKHWVAQKHIEGKEYSTYGIANNGKLLAHCTYHSSFRAGVGSGICFQSEVNNSITEYARTFVEQHQFTGQIGFDCIVDKDGKVWVIEGNPRSTSGLHLFDQDFKLVDLILGRTESLVEAESAMSCMIGAAMLFFGLPKAILKGRIGLFFREFFKSRDVLFSWSDLMPFLGIPLALGELSWIALRNGVSLQQASTLDIEWNGELLDSQKEL